MECKETQAWIRSTTTIVWVRRPADLWLFAGPIIRYTIIAIWNAAQFGKFPEDFKASNHWLDNFLQRHVLSWRSSTTRGDACQWIINRALAFKPFVDFKNSRLYFCINIDIVSRTWLLWMNYAKFMGQWSQSTCSRRCVVNLHSFNWLRNSTSYILSIWPDNSLEYSWR